MKFVIVFAAVMAVSSAQFPGFGKPVYRPLPSTQRPAVVSVNHVASSDKTASIIRSENDSSPDGSFKYTFETDNGITFEAQGTPRDFGGNPPVIPVLIQGSYSYISPEGQPISFTYRADENGFQPQGDSIPTPPPVPEAILRALEYISKNPPQKK